MKDTPDLIELQISTTETAGCQVVTLAGECDLATAPALRSCLCRLLNRWRRPVVVDLREVAFIDSSGLNALVAAYRRAAQLGCPFALAGPSPPAAKVLKVSGLDNLFPIYDCVRTACAAAASSDSGPVNPALLAAAIWVEDYLVTPAPPNPRRSA